MPVYTTTVYIRSNKDTNYEIGERIGLTADAIRVFDMALFEVALGIEVNDFGDVKFRTVNGKKVED